MNKRLEKLAWDHVNGISYDNDKECKCAYLAGYQQAIKDVTEMVREEGWVFYTTGELLNRKALLSRLKALAEGESE